MKQENAVLKLTTVNNAKAEKKPAQGIRGEAESVLKGYLKKRVGKKLSAQEIADGVKRDRKWIDNHLWALTKKGLIFKEKSGRYFVYWYPKKGEKPPIKKARTKAPKSSIKRQPKRQSEASINIPDFDPSMMDFSQFSFTGMIQQVTNIQRQNQMYQQALQQIAAILIQVGIIEEK